MRAERIIGRQRRVRETARSVHMQCHGRAVCQRGLRMAIDLAAGGVVAVGRQVGQADDGLAIAFGAGNRVRHRTGIGGTDTAAAQRALGQGPSTASAGAEDRSGRAGTRQAVTFCTMSWSGS